MKNHRPFAATMIGLLSSAMLASCGSPTDRTGKSELTVGDQMGLSRSKAEQVKAMDGAPYVFHWANFVSGQTMFEAINAEALDVGGAGDAPFVLAAAAHVPMKLVAVMRTPGDGTGILVQADSPIKTISDLKGRHVVVSAARGSISQYLLLEALKRQGIPSSDVTISFMPPGDAAAAFGAGQIDAWATFGSFQAIAETQGARVLLSGKGISPGVVVFAASDVALADPSKRAAITDYLQRQATANGWSHAHPDAYAKLYARQTGVSPQVASMIAYRENPEIKPVDAAAIADLQKLADSFTQYGVIPSHVDIAPFVDASVFPPRK